MQLSINLGYLLLGNSFKTYCFQWPWNSCHIHMKLLSVENYCPWGGAVASSALTWSNPYTLLRVKNNYHPLSAALSTITHTVVECWRSHLSSVTFLECWIQWPKMTEIGANQFIFAWLKVIVQWLCFPWSNIFVALWYFNLTTRMAPILFSYSLIL